MIHFNPVEVLTNLISIQSLSKEEEPARNLIESILSECKIDFTIDFLFSQCIWNIYTLIESNFQFSFIFI